MRHARTILAKRILLHLSIYCVSANMLAGTYTEVFAGISAAKDVPQQKPHLSRAAGRTPATAQALDSDDALESDEPSDSDQVSHSDKGSDSEMLDSDSEGEVCDTDSDGAADQTLGDIEAAAANHRSLEERRAGMPAETRGQPAVTPGKQVVALLYSTAVNAVHSVTTVEVPKHCVLVFCHCAGAKHHLQMWTQTWLTVGLPAAGQVFQAPLFDVVM